MWSLHLQRFAIFQSDQFQLCLDAVSCYYYTANICMFNVSINIEAWLILAVVPVQLEDEGAIA